MKVRKGFVSNSSTTSFVCCICSEVEAAQDCGISDFNMVECENDHTFHTDCLPTEVSERLQCDRDGSNDEEIQWGYIPQEMCPFCRMELISGDDLLKYVLRDNSRDSLVKEIQNRFKMDYKSFQDYLKSQ